MLDAVFGLSFGCDVKKKLSPIKISPAPASASRWTAFIAGAFTELFHLGGETGSPHAELGRRPHRAVGGGAAGEISWTALPLDDRRS